MGSVVEYILTNFHQCEMVTVNYRTHFSRVILLQHLSVLLFSRFYLETLKDLKFSLTLVLTLLDAPVQSDTTALP